MCCGDIRVGYCCWLYWDRWWGWRPISITVRFISTSEYWSVHTSSVTAVLHLTAVTVCWFYPGIMSDGWSFYGCTVITVWIVGLVFAIVRFATCVFGCCVMLWWFVVIVWILLFIFSICCFFTAVRIWWLVVTVMYFCYCFITVIFYYS